MTAFASPAAGAATAALAAPTGQPASAPLTRVALAYIEPRFKLSPVSYTHLDVYKRQAIVRIG